MKQGIATRSKIGESACGDAYLIENLDDRTVVCVVDGAGHGENAAVASQKAIVLLKQNLKLEPEDMIKMCHKELINTRGAVIGIAVIHEKENTLSYIGVGNISAVLVRDIASQTESRHLTSLSGIMGYNLRTVKTFRYPYRTGDILTMFSDGISSRVDIPSYLSSSKDDLQDIANLILREHGKNEDDATIVMVS